ncbi:MAG: PAS domain S-box protein [Coleofasciculus sp. B1-GNL1-01]|uniref:PAS domain S-box protein n=1 Tax=Coleofasciculus sp. B1-GNL1-01 TaxID=3068484 RepID=UPI0032FF4287
MSQPLPTPESLPLNALKEQRELTAAMLDLIGALIVILDAQGRIVYFNHACEQLTGYLCQEVQGKYAWDLLILPEDVASIQAIFDNLIPDNFPQPCESCWVTRDGDWRWIAWMDTVCLNEQGAVEYVIATGQDITERKQAEKALRELATLNQAILDSANYTIISTTVDGTISTFNRAAEKWLGYSASDVVGKTTPALFHDPEEMVERSRELCKELGTLIQPGFETFVAKARWGEIDEREWTYIRHDRSLFPVLLSITALYNSDNQIVGFLGIGSDISLRKQAEQSLRDSQHFSQRIADTVPGILYLYDVIEQRNVYANRSTVELLGYTPQDIQDIGTDFMSHLVHPEDIPHIIEHQKHLTTLTENDHLTLEYRMKHANGEWRWLRSRETVFSRTVEELPKLVLGIAEDITDYKRVEDALRQTNEDLEQRVKQRTVELENAHHQLRFHVENSPLGVIEWDSQFRVQRWSKQAEFMFGWKGEDVLGKRLTDWQFVYPDDLEFVHQKALNLLNPESPPEIIENRNLTKDGNMVYCQWYNSVLFDESNAVVSILSLVQDQTERKHSEEQLQQLNQQLQRSNQELEQFAYVASHDLREPLRKIRSYSDLLVKRYQGQLDERADKYINYITDSVIRMQALITDLLTYSRVSRNELVLEPTDLGEILQQTLMDLSPAIEENHAIINTTLLPIVQANPLQIGQVLQNLIANAIKFCREQPPRIDIKADCQDNFWQISIQDNGIGIDPNYSDRIFAIFQRLHYREEYPGTGIGLAICQKIVERHGGKIWVESEFGQGSTFYFTLPVV